MRGDVCFFAHFDQQSVVDRYVLRYLTKLKDAGFSNVFITSAHLSASGYAALQQVCDDIIVRPNEGLDFGSWAAALRKHELRLSGRLLLANDSVYGPIGDLNVALRRLTDRERDFYGMVESIDKAPHLQSWFLLLENRVVKSGAFREVLSQNFGHMTKDEIIKNGEIGLSVALRQAGFTYRALYAPEQQGPMGRSLPLNPTYHLMRELVQDFGVPFAKVATVRAKLDSRKVRQFIGPRDSEIAELIISHQKRTTAPFPDFGRLDKIYGGFVRLDHWTHRRQMRAAENLNFVVFNSVLTLWTRIVDLFGSDAYRMRLRRRAERR